jgi:thiamine-phosphate pyrophosphorylase
MLMLREHALCARERLALGATLLQIAAHSGQLLSVNDRLDIALELGAPAVHLGEQSVDVVEARSLLAEGVFISAAVHDPVKACSLDVDAVLLSPIVSPRKGRAALGIDRLKAAAQLLSGHTDAPALYALGGIGAAEVPDCLAAGATGIAAVGAVYGGESLEALLGALGIKA